MGTSASSRGPGAGVPLVPEWVPAAPGQQPAPAAGNDPPIMAPPGRFRPARTSLGQYGRDGGLRELRRGLGHYSRKGLGGAASAAQRMAGTAQTAGGLYGVLDALRTGAALPPDVAISSGSLAGRTQREIADIITDALRPVDGTQDTEAARDAVSRALSEVLEQNPNADLAALTPPEIDLVIESYIASDLTHRIELDVGKAILDKAPNYAQGVDRLEEMKAYVRQEVARAFRARVNIGQTMNRQVAASLASDIVRDTFEIFESYL